MSRRYTDQAIKPPRSAGPRHFQHRRLRHLTTKRPPTTRRTCKQCHDSARECDALQVHACKNTQACAAGSTSAQRRTAQTTAKHLADCRHNKQQSAAHLSVCKHTAIGIAAFPDMSSAAQVDAAKAAEHQANSHAPLTTSHPGKHVCSKDTEHAGQPKALSDLVH